MLLDRFRAATKALVKNCDIVEARGEVALGFALIRECASHLRTDAQRTFVRTKGPFRFASCPV